MKKKIEFLKPSLSEVNLAKHSKVIVSFGGGQGGGSYRYGVCSDIHTCDTKITFKGYKLNDAISVTKNQWVFRSETDKKLLVFDTQYWPNHRIENLLRCLRSSNLALAIAEYQATDPHNQPLVLPLEEVTAVGNWILTR